MSVQLKAFLGLLNLCVILGLCVFLSAGTLRYPQGWVCISLFGLCSLAITLWLARHDPKLLERRTKAGPIAEEQGMQKVIQGLASLAFLALLVLPGLDHRWGWSRVPLAVSVAGDVLMVAGFAFVFRVFRVNTFTSGVIEVAAGQTVIDTGPYARVRHPMYAGAFVLLVGIPLSLGSFVGLAAVIPLVAVIVWRLLDEERVLRASLPGYAAYCSRTRYRLIRGVW